MLTILNSSLTVVRIENHPATCNRESVLISVSLVPQSTLDHLCSHCMLRIELAGLHNRPTAHTEVNIPIWINSVLLTPLYAADATRPDVCSGCANKTVPRLIDWFLNSNCFSMMARYRELIMIKLCASSIQSSPSSWFHVILIGTEQHNFVQ